MLPEPKHQYQNQKMETLQRASKIILEELIRRARAANALADKLRVIVQKIHSDHHAKFDNYQ